MKIRESAESFLRSYKEDISYLRDKKKEKGVDIKHIDARIKVLGEKCDLLSYLLTLD